MKARTILRINRYPNNGFGEKCGMYYLINEFGHIFDIEDYYEKTDDKMMKMVEYHDHTFYADDIEGLIETLKLEMNVDIKKW